MESGYLKKQLEERNKSAVDAVIETVHQTRQEAKDTVFSVSTFVKKLTENEYLEVSNKLVLVKLILQ